MFVVNQDSTTNTVDVFYTRRNLIQGTIIEVENCKASNVSIN